MRYLALVTDYDGTRSSDDRVSEEAVSALERLRVSGRRAILVTGRRLDDLLVAGPSGSDKSTLAAGIIERFIDKDYQVCIVDLDVPPSPRRLFVLVPRRDQG